MDRRALEGKPRLFVSHYAELDLGEARAVLAKARGRSNMRTPILIALSTEMDLVQALRLSSRLRKTVLQAGSTR